MSYKKKNPYKKLNMYYNSLLAINLNIYAHCISNVACNESAKQHSDYGNTCCQISYSQRSTLS